ncbi:VOC family protein [Streptomyces sp. SID8379]|uniref:VOC family protein n=1 Tax=unclassified Streptomyces TaxID=2593676 RepID=UPI000477414B|nr:MULTISPECIES: VOC family protein [unclassified Streptomyces]MYW63444.1 VOC family protein [Streptomyces sp. SID8379]
MACRISELVLQCRDPDAMAEFWCAVLDFVVLSREGEVDGEEYGVEIGPREGYGGAQPVLFLLRHEAPDNSAHPLHIDVSATDRDQDAELERLLSLGAGPADIDQGADVPWKVLADPEGNVFCLLKGRVKPLEGSATSDH